MAEESAKLRIPYIAASQAQKHVTHNEGVTLLDTLVQLSVLDKDLAEPPAEPAEGDTYIVAGTSGGATGTGGWAGWDARVARYIDGAWRSYLPGQGGGAGWLAWVLDEDAMYRFDGADWALAGIEGPEGPEGPAGADGDDGEDGQSFHPDAVVALIAGRDSYDEEAAAFSVLVVSDSGNGDKPTLYFKLSAGSADWSDGIIWTPEGGGGGVGYRYLGTVTFTSSGTFSKASYPDLTAVRVRLSAGGGAGGGAPSTSGSQGSAGSGGAAGGYAEKFIEASSLAADETVTVGAGGSPSGGSAGGNGGNTAFGSHASATGGDGGGIVAAGSGTSPSGPSVGGGASGGDLNIGGGAGSGGFRQGSSPNVGIGGAGASGPLGGGGAGGARGNVVSNTTASAGTGHGAGGGGGGNDESQSARPGGAGAPGVVLVDLYAGSLS